MKRSVSNGSERTDGCFTAAFSKTQHASFSVRCGTVAAQRLAVAMEHESGRSPAEIVGSNPTGGMDGCLLCVVS